MNRAIFAIGAAPGKELRLVNNLVKAGDASDESTALHIENLPSTLINNTFVGGAATVTYGAVVNLSGTEGLDSKLVNNIFQVGPATGNASVLGFNPSKKTTLPGTILLLNNDVTGATPDCLLIDSSNCLTTLADVNACEWLGCKAAAGNLNAAPTFVNAGTGDFHLQATSTLIDAGISPLPYAPADLNDEIWRDLEGNPRPAGDGWDIGAYESAAD
jgi:hypothetical protein